jgi:type IV secretion system protein TrbL
MSLLSPSTLPAFQSPVTSVVSGGIEWIGGEFADLGANMFKMALAAMASPSSTEQISNCNGSSIGACAPNWIFIQTYWLVFVVATVSIIIAGVRLMLSRDAKPAKDMAIGLAITALSVAGGLGFVVLAMQASDGLADGMLGNLTGGTWGKDVTAESIFPDEGSGMAINAMMLLFAPWIALMAAVQMMLMYARLGMIVVFAGLLPLAASATMTATGRGWFLKITAWLFAAIIYKPVAVLIYAVAYQMMLGESSSAVFGGIALMTLAVLALPALMRLFVPATAAAAGRGGGGAAIGGAVATGAIMLASGGSAAAAVPAMAAGAGGSVGSGGGK